MMQFVNNLISNFTLTNFVYIIAYIIESYLFLTMLLLIFEVKATIRQKFLYMLLIIPIGDVTKDCVPSPFNVILNYTYTIIIIRLIFHIGFLKSLTSLVITSFVFGLMNVLIQNPYLTFFDVSPEEFINTPKYRIPYLIILYLSFLAVILFFSKFKKIKFNLDLLDSLDNKTVAILCLNLVMGFLTLCIQLIITAYYIAIVPIIITALSFISLGAQRPMPEWGAMIKDSLELIYLAPWTVLLPGFAIIFTILLSIIFTNGLCQAINKYYE